MPDPKTEKLNSALYWFPRVKDITPTPNTRFVPYDHGMAMWDLMSQQEGMPRKYVWPVPRVRSAAKEIGYPVFIRTDLGSAKHQGAKAYRANVSNDVTRILHALVEDNEEKFFPVCMAAAFMVRKWLELDYAFVAFGGHRIAREWRYFVKDGKLVCAHFYWPEEAIQFYGDVKEPNDWREKLAAMAVHAPGVNLEPTAVEAASKCDAHPQWSVDFAADKNGIFWLIDMAIAGRSWHPDCPKKKVFHGT